MEATLHQLGDEATNSPMHLDYAKTRVWKKRDAQLAAVNTCQSRSSLNGKDPWE